MNTCLSDSQIEFLIDLLKTNSPSGHEVQMVQLLQNRLSSFCAIETDHIGNLYMHTGQEGGLKVMISAHADEVGFQIVHIDKNGYAFVRSVASVDQQTIPGSRVVALGKNGVIPGVIGKISPHITEPKDREIVPQLRDLWVDFGFSSYDEAIEHIESGDYLTLSSSPVISSNGEKIISKALDNKISVFILSEVVKRLTETDTPLEIIGVATAQEELGSRGAFVAANRIKPDIAFCLDVEIATDIPTMSVQNYGTFELGKGVGIVRNSNNNEILTEVLLKAAGNHNIPFQKITGFTPNGGTETAMIQMAQSGVATANLCIPNRYMHSLVEMCDLNDVVSAIELLIASIQELANFRKDDFNLFLRF